MPKNSSEYLTNNYGFITDYLAEAFHYQFSHSNRYEEVSKRIRLGKFVEGRDKKGVKKTVCAFLKILHPAGEPDDEEFEEYVAYAVECRRRVKEQMNKRKPDDEFANINLSYITADGREVVVYCPESRNAQATKQPVRKELGQSSGTDFSLQEEASKDKQPLVGTDERAGGKPSAAQEVSQALPGSPNEDEPREQHFTILYGDTGYSYESIIGPYLKGAREITVEDPYIRLPHQIQNFVRFCETIVKLSTIRQINLLTGYDENTKISEMHDRLGEVKQSLLELDIVLDIKLNPNLHDREIRLDNGWVIKIGRGLDFYQKPGSWYEIGAIDLSLRKCLETKVDIFKKISLNNNNHVAVHAPWR